MNFWKRVSTKFYWQWLLVLLIIIGVSFRVVGLEERVYWVDEVATSIRVAGYTKAQLMALLSDGPPLHPDQLQQFLQLSDQTSWSRTLAALSQSPEHTPLYFLLVRSWVQLWGSSVVAVRSLSVLLSLMALGLIGTLAYRLYASAKAGLIAVVLLSLSPFFVSYAQEARPYSLWSVTLLLSGLLLLSAMQQPTKGRWLGYGLSVSVGLYTSLLSTLVVLGQGLYVLKVGNRKHRQGFGLAVAVALLSFVPWLGVMVAHWGALEGNTEWMRQPMGGLSLLMIWLYSLVIVFFDAPVVLSSPIVTTAKFLTALLVLVGIGAALSWLCRRAAPSSRYFVLALALPVPITLIMIDLLQQGQSSATPRYLIPLQLGVLLAIAGWTAAPRWPQAGALKEPLHERRPSPLKLKQGFLAFLITVSLLSSGFSLWQTPDYQKSRSRYNASIAAIINQYPSPLLLAESTQTIDILSLSRDLKPHVKIQIFRELSTLPQTCDDVLLFNPSVLLQQQLQQGNRIMASEIFRPPLLTPMDTHLSLWSVTQSTQFCNPG